MSMCSLDIKFFDPPKRISSTVDQYQTYLKTARPFLDTVGVITHEYPTNLNLRLECPVDQIKNIVQFLTIEHHIGIVKVISMDPVHHREMGSDGG